jgi:hypothetical protein
MQADRVGGGGGGGVCGGCGRDCVGGSLLVPSLHLSLSLSLSLSLAVGHPSICIYEEPTCVTKADGRATVS